MFSLSLLYTLFMYPTVSNLFNLYGDNENNKCLFDILQLHTRLTEFFLNTVTCFVLPFYMRISSVWWRILRSWSGTFRISPFRQFFFDYLTVNVVLFKFSYLSILFLMLVLLVYVFDVCVSEIIYVVCIYVVCIMYTLCLVGFAFVAFSLSISFISMIFVIVAFAFCSHVEW